MIECAFFVDHSWAQLIVSGKKIWELRSTRTRIIDEEVGIIATGSGAVIATCKIADCIGPLSDRELAETEHYHRTTAEVRVRPKGSAPWRYAWKLADVRSLRQPVPYDHPWGAQGWVKIGPAVAEHVRRQLAAQR